MRKREKRYRHGRSRSMRKVERFIITSSTDFSSGREAG